MPKFNVTVYAEMKCWDQTKVQVEAADAKAAGKAAMRLIRKADRTGEDIDWEPARSETFTQTGKLDFGSVEEA